MIKPTFKLEKELLEQGYEMIIGVDEAGKGPLAGPVVACAASLKYSGPPLPPGEGLGVRDKSYAIPVLQSSLTCPSDIPASPAGGLSRGERRQMNLSFDLIRDSKTLNHKQRESLYDFIYEHFYVGVGICDHKTIDRINILQASFLAMKKALASLRREISNYQFPIPNQFSISNDKISKNTKYQIPDTKYIILIDGSGLIPNFSMEQRAIVKGDRTVKSISAASIIAKVTRDRIMLEMHEKYPEYGFDQHKGYGTKLHMEMLAKHGPSEIHRQSFAPVKLARAE